MRLGFVIPFEDEAVIWSDKVETAQEAGPGNNDLAITPNSLVFSAAGEAKTFTVVTKKGVTPEVNTVVDGFTVKAGETSEANGVNVTTVTVTAADNSSGINPRVGQVRVNLPDSDRGAVVTLNQRTEDIDTVFP